MRRKGAEGVKVDTRKLDISRCMVVGCDRAALYRNAKTSTHQGVVRGYCAKHKHLAVGKYSEKTFESVNSWNLRGCE